MVNITKETRANLKAIYSVITYLEKFPLPKIKGLVTDHSIWLQKDTITPEMQILVDRSLPVFGPLLAAISAQEIDKSGGSADVVSFDEIFVTLPARVDRIKTMVKNLMQGNNAILVFLNLDKVNYYYKGKQAEIVAKLANLVVKITATPVLSTVIPVATALKSDVSGSYDIKHKKFDEIKDDRTNMMPLIIDAKIMLIRNFGALNDNLWENLANVCNYFPIADMNAEVHLATFLLKNEYFIKGFQGTAINLIDVNFKFGNYIEVDCRKCPVGVHLFLASEITDVIPMNAQYIKKGDRIIFKSNTVGSSTQGYLMAIYDTDESVAEECQFKMKIDKKKPQRKNIIAPVVATPAPIVATAETLIVLPETKVVPPETPIVPPEIAA